MRQKVIKVGHSLAVTIPSDFVKAAGITPGQAVEISLLPEQNQLTVIFPQTHQLPLLPSRR
ncbi:hypothetical protein A2368_00790 [Candidatus Collierbacteria bacterium RIFOXYB1_FULL_49_13]|uniref:SpoVT-AbrB domain-containing protein n=1 Tax=Candidatus Collierbacteria bacterium RIFOXYB1_FULL_49_13 TaxID=1817728 RepID=A0A1F5FHG8_9BACT|nr:MAG: hypothetical protein A2368_00790 [Candidatus Collierbacteria bacterium RIFOXYB1_FULL_49_13]